MEWWTSRRQHLESQRTCRCPLTGESKNRREWQTPWWYMSEGRQLTPTGTYCNDSSLPSGWEHECLTNCSSPSANALVSKTAKTTLSWIHGSQRSYIKTDTWILKIAHKHEVCSWHLASCIESYHCSRKTEAHWQSPLKPHCLTAEIWCSLLGALHQWCFPSVLLPWSSSIVTSGPHLWDYLSLAGC